MTWHVISLGGSLICPDKVDVDFLKEFQRLINKKIEQGHKFVIYCGGGKLARNYQTSASLVRNISADEKDWIGIESTKLNAYLVKLIFDERLVYHSVVSDPTQKISTEKSIIVCSGWKPGWSTDYGAVMFTKTIGAKIVINMSNIDFVYDQDPKKNSSARPFKKMTWPEFRALVGEFWSPGLNAPFDPIAAKLAQEIGIKVVIIGKDLANLEKLLDNTDYRGTTIF